jgi:chorismate synthase
VRLLRILTAGESHGPQLTGILEGLPAGLPLTADSIAEDLARRQLGYGRGGRMKIEKDRAEIVGGVRHGLSTGAPLALVIKNKDWKNWTEAMRIEPGGDPTLKAVRIPRPGHADYAGSVKYRHTDLRNVLERASARETAMRVALGSAARQLLEQFNISIASRVVSIGSVTDPTDPVKIPIGDLNSTVDASPVRCLDEQAAQAMIAEIEKTKKAGDTLGGVFEVCVSGLPTGLGSYAQWDRRLEGELGKALLSLNAIKGVEIGLGFNAATRPGSQVHDALYWNDDKTAARRETNHSGGVDGGLTTGEPLVVRAAMKPISTLMQPLGSIDLASKEQVPAHVERSDFCAVPAAAVIGEALVALECADAFLQKFGGDSLAEIQEHYAG